MFGTLSSLYQGWKPCISPKVAFAMEVSSPCIPCVITRTSQSVKFSKLKKFPPPPILLEEQEEWEVVQVLDSKLKRGRLWYLLEWKGFSEDPERTAWEPASNLTNPPDFFKDLHSLYPDKPGPNTSSICFYRAWWGLDFMKVSSSPCTHL
ncbi:hypothetical protein O181_077481 [Austropuccinia psidii MF-1]|uniref:Chromo domain-containing protein n=1 Tax=Austropuccinia psidii MF-1 TaxID=1389203 RepID=A0A9Q3FCE5_9BASI|nr:hypothetical protein [Austropuccinia psidii MF-1]